MIPTSPKKSSKRNFIRLNTFVSRQLQGAEQEEDKKEEKREEEEKKINNFVFPRIDFRLLKNCTQRVKVYEGKFCNTILLVHEDKEKSSFVPRTKKPNFSISPIKLAVNKYKPSCRKGSLEIISPNKIKESMPKLRLSRNVSSNNFRDSFLTQRKIEKQQTNMNIKKLDILCSPEKQRQREKEIASIKFPLTKIENKTGIFKYKDKKTDKLSRNISDSFKTNNRTRNTINHYFTSRDFYFDK
jgi:hypothetical protein